MNKKLFIAGAVVGLVVIAAFGQARRYSDYPNKVAVTNGGWVLLWAEPGVTNYNQTFAQLTNQLWSAIISGTNYGAFSVLGKVVATNTVEGSSVNSTNAGFKSRSTNNVVLACPDGGSWVLKIANDGTLSVVTNTTGL